MNLHMLSMQTVLILSASIHLRCVAKVNIENETLLKLRSEHLAELNKYIKKMMWGDSERLRNRSERRRRSCVGVKITLAHLHTSVLHSSLHLLKTRHTV